MEISEKPRLCPNFTPSIQQVLYINIHRILYFSVSIQEIDVLRCFYQQLNKETKNIYRFVPNIE